MSEWPSELEMDQGLREGAEEISEVEEVIPAEDEVLVGSPDLLAGPDAGIEGDLGDALEENVPWDPRPNRYWQGRRVPMCDGRTTATESVAHLRPSHNSNRDWMTVLPYL